MSGTSNPGITVNLPQAGGPIVNSDGSPTSNFIAFLLALYNRTGGTVGVSTQQVEEIAAEAQTAATEANEAAMTAQTAAATAAAAAATATSAAAAAQSTANDAEVLAVFGL